MASSVCGLPMSDSEASTSLAQRRTRFQMIRPGYKAMGIVSSSRIASRVNDSDEPVTYLDETTMVSRYYEDPDYIEIDQHDPWLDGREQAENGSSIRNAGPMRNPSSRDVEITSAGPSLLQHSGEVGNNWARPHGPFQAGTPVHESQNRHLLSATPRTESSTVHGSPGSSSSRSYSTAYPLSVASGPPNTILTQREAMLMRNFTDNMALWVRSRCLYD